MTEMMFCLPALLITATTVYLISKMEVLLNIRRYDLESPWFEVLFFLVLAEAVAICLLSINERLKNNNNKTFLSRGVYSFIRRPINTTAIFHFNILFSMWKGSYVLFFSIPFQYLVWCMFISKEEQRLAGIYGQEYLDYMSSVSRFFPWR